MGLDASTRAQVDQSVAAVLDGARLMVAEYAEESDTAIAAMAMEMDLMVGIRAHVLAGDLSGADKIIQTIVTAYTVFAMRHVRGTQW